MPCGVQVRQQGPALRTCWPSCGSAMRLRHQTALRLVMPTPRWHTFFNGGMLKQKVEYTSEAPSYPMHPQICCSVPSLLAARPCLTCLDWPEGAQAGKDPSRAVRDASRSAACMHCCGTWV